MLDAVDQLAHVARPVVVPVALIVTLGLLFNAFRSLPLALLVQRSIAVVIVGGTVSAAIHTLVVLPVLYRTDCAWAERRAERRAFPSQRALSSRA